VGYYRLPDRTIAVFDHQTGCFDELLRQCLDGSLKGKPLSSYFVDVPPPYPTTRTLRELVDFTREFKERPEFVALDAQIGPGLAADRILAGGEIAEARRAEIIESVFLNSIARSAFRSLEHFEEAVDRELRDRRRTRHRLNPERPLPAPRPKLPKLPRCDRSLEPARTMALETARRILPLEHASRLEGPPPVTWTSQVVSSTFGHWSLTLNGAARGRQTIRINTLLRSTVGRIPDEMLAYLIYHELLHHLLPGQGHDAEFRELEARWPNAAKWDAEIDTIHEHWDISPPRYNG
jgi:hypothetical protein